MAVFHVSVDRIVKGSGMGGATGFAQYIAREQPDKATQHARYLTRESHPAKDDLVRAGHDNLPGWAKDATHFFRMADQYERRGGIVARTYEVALPRELSPEQRQALADDIRSAFFNRHPHAWAMHNPTARDGQEQPHVHIMVCERMVDGLERGPQRFFSRAANHGDDPARGGAKKELYWNTQRSLTERRAGIATLINASLERHGHLVAVSALPLKDRGYGYDREPERDQGSKARYLYAKHGITTKGWQQTLADRAILHREIFPVENQMNLEAWRQQKTREGIHDLSRAAMVDHVRDTFWRHDRSPARQAEREASMLRSLDRALAQRAQTHTQAPAREQTRERQPGRQQGLSLGLGMDDTAHGGAHVRQQDHALEWTR